MTGAATEARTATARGRRLPRPIPEANVVLWASLRVVRPILPLMVAVHGVARQDAVPAGSRNRRARGPTSGAVDGTGVCRDQRQGGRITESARGLRPRHGWLWTTTTQAERCGSFVEMAEAPAVVRTGIPSGQHQSHELHAQPTCPEGCEFRRRHQGGQNVRSGIGHLSLDASHVCGKKHIPLSTKAAAGHQCPQRVALLCRRQIVIAYNLFDLRFQPCGINLAHGPLHQCLIKGSMVCCKQPQLVRRTLQTNRSHREPAVPPVPTPCGSGHKLARGDVYPLVDSPAKECRHGPSA